jgi:AraC-like DNA-binding protein
MQNLDVLSPEEFEAALDAAIDVALVLLRKQAARERPPEDKLLVAAKAFIEANAGNVKLSPNAMARALGCSRAVLYRSFANADLTVASYLRDVRFRHFLTALRTQPEASISQLSYQCGFAANASDFSKLFKRTYGITPREARAQLTK